MTDRLKELKAKSDATGAGQVAIEIPTVGGGGGSEEKESLVTPQVNSNANLSNDMKQFFGDVEIVKLNINIIKDSTKKIHEKTQKVILATTPEDETRISQELEPIVKQTNAEAARTKKILQILKDDTEKKKGELTSKPSETRIRENLI